MIGSALGDAGGAAAQPVVGVQQVLIGQARLPGEFTQLADARGTTAFVHGSGSSHLSPRNRFVARVLHGYRQNTLLFDLLSADEAASRQHVFDIDLLAQRLAQALHWLHDAPGQGGAPVGLFGASTGAAAALRLAALRPGWVSAVVSRGGRPDLAAETLGQVQAPTLLIVGSLDTAVLRLNQAALRALRCPSRLEVVAGASHLFDEPGTLAVAANLAGRWLSGDRDGLPGSA